MANRAMLSGPEPLFDAVKKKVCVADREEQMAKRQNIGTYVLCIYMSSGVV